MWKFKVSAETNSDLFIFKAEKNRWSSSAFKILTGIEGIRERTFEAPNVTWILHFLRK